MGGDSIDKKTFDAGQNLFVEGSPGDCAYLIEDGTVTVYKMTPDGRDLKIAQLKRGDVVGEMALVDNAARGASAKADGAVKVSVITRSVLETRIGKAPPMIRLLLASLVKRLRDTNYSMVNAPVEGWQAYSD